MSNERPKSTLAAAMQARIDPNAKPAAPEMGSLARAMMERVGAPGRPARTLADRMRERCGGQSGGGSSAAPNGPTRLPRPLAPHESAALKPADATGPARWEITSNARGA